MTKKYYGKSEKIFTSIIFSSQKNLKKTINFKEIFLFFY